MIALGLRLRASARPRVRGPRRRKTDKPRRGCARVPDEPLGGDPLHLYVARGEVPWEERDGTILIAMPKEEGRVARAFSRLLRAPQAVSVRLDAAGTATWLLADGSRTGEDIAAELATRFGGDGWAARVKAFLAVLEPRGLVRLAPQPTAPADRFAGFPPETGFRAESCRRCATTVRVKGPGRLVYQCPGCGRIVRTRSEG